MAFPGQGNCRTSFPVCPLYKTSRYNAPKQYGPSWQHHQSRLSDRCTSGRFLLLSFFLVLPPLSPLLEPRLSVSVCVSWSTVYPALGSLSYQLMMDAEKRQFQTVGHANLAKDAAEMMFDGLLANLVSLCDFLV